jgi:hypothetical protein
VPSSAATGTYNLTANATAVNSTGGDLHSLSFIFIDNVEVTVQAAPTQLGTVIATVSTSSSSAPAAAAGGGGAGIIQGLETIVIERGRSQTVPFTIRNIYEGTTMDDIYIEFDGFMSQYITIQPDTLNDIPFGESKNFLLTINIPSYFIESNYELTATIKGTLVANNPQKAGYISKSFTQLKKVTLKVVEVSQGDLSNLVLQATQCISDMEEAKFGVSIVKGMFQDARTKILNDQAAPAKVLLEDICELRDTAFESDELRKMIEERLEKALDEGLDVPLTIEQLGLAKLAFDREDYKLALDRLKAAELQSVLETKGQINIIRYVQRNWDYLILAGIILFFFLLCMQKRFYLLFVKSRIKSYNREEVSIEDLIIGSQKAYFKDQTISEGVFKHRIVQLEKRLTELRKLRVSLRHKKSTLLNPEQELKDLTKEKKEVVKALKKIQTKHFAGRLIKSKFTRYSDAYQARLSEIDLEKGLLRQKHRVESKRTKFFIMINKICTFGGIFTRKQKKKRFVRKTKKIKKRKRK